MIRKALKSAVGVSVGTIIGGAVLPWILFTNNTYPSLLEQAALYLPGS